MSVYTTVTREELAAWLTQFDVGTLVEQRGIAAGIENTNYYVETTRGRYILTLFEKLTAQELPFYLGLMAHLADRGIPSARPVPDARQRILGELNGKPAALVAFLEGRDVERPDSDHCSKVGSMLAQIHMAGLSYATHMANPRGLSWWQAVIPELTPFLDGHDLALLTGEVSFQARQDTSDLPRGAIHADLFRDNVLFDRGRIAGVIDFYFACTDTFAYDIAITVNDWCVQSDGRLDALRSDALLRGYAQVRPYTAHERAAWPAMLRAAALRFWISRLYDYHLPRPGELTHAKDPAHFSRILRQHLAHAGALP